MGENGRPRRRNGNECGRGAGRKEQVNKKSGEWGERGLRVSEKQPSPAHHLGKGEGNLSEGRLVAGDPSWRLSAWMDKTQSL